jgi:hypothetical protein
VMTHGLFLNHVRSIMLDYHQVQHNCFQVLSTMSSSIIPEFNFPKSMFFLGLQLPNDSHPWSEEFKKDAELSVFHPRTQEQMEYPASILNMRDLRDLEKETMLTEYQEVYSSIEQFKVIREANWLQEGMFFLY